MAISRREFSKLGAFGIAAHAFSSTPLLGQAGQKKIGYCVIGLGRIADHHIRGIAQGSTSAVTGLVSGHRDKAEKIAAQYGVPKESIYSYEDMDRIRDNKAIDAVIVCLPNLPPSLRTHHSQNDQTDSRWRYRQGTGHRQRQWLQHRA
jgi:hypothetical protein